MEDTIMINISELEKEAQDKAQKKVFQMVNAIRLAQEIGKPLGYRIEIHEEKSGIEIINKKSYGTFSKATGEVLDTQSGNFTLADIISAIEMKYPGIKIREGFVYNIINKLIKENKIKVVKRGNKVVGKSIYRKVS
jgi:hypothetical protein